MKIQAQTAAIFRRRLKAMVNNISGGGYNLTDAIIRQTEKIKSSERPQGGSRSDQNLSFEEIFNEKRERILFSKHANLRTEQRNIRISNADLDRLGDACVKAEEKGIKDALIVMNDSAFIVNAQNRVVITVVDKTEMKNNVFSNIDGAIFI